MCAEGTQKDTQLDLGHNECRRARISQGYKAGELQPHYLYSLSTKIVAMTELHKHVNHK